MGTGGGVKWPERDADYSPPSSTEVNNEWNYTSAPPLCLHGVGRENFIIIIITDNHTSQHLCAGKPSPVPDC